MEAVQIKKALKAVKFHAKIAWRGFFRTLYGATVAGLIAMAVYGFVSVRTKADGRRFAISSLLVQRLLWLCQVCI